MSLPSADPNQDLRDQLGKMVLEDLQVLREQLELRELWVREVCQAIRDCPDRPGLLDLQAKLEKTRIRQA